MRLARKLILATLAGMALVLAASAYFRITRELELFERDMIMDHAVLARTLANAMSRVWADNGRDEALNLLEGVSTPDGRFRVRWVDGEPPAAQALSRERHDTDVPIHVHGQAVGFVELSESRAYERAYIRDTLIRVAWATLAAAVVAALLAALLGLTKVGRPMA
jgi:hypothetical protein